MLMKQFPTLLGNCEFCSLR